MPNDYVIEEHSVGVLQSKFLLLDTNFLIDASIFPSEALGLVEKLRKLSCELVTTRAVIIEFLGGTRNRDHHKAKVDFLELLFGKALTNLVGLPIEARLPTQEEIISFSRQTNKFSPTDFELYLTLEKYSHGNLVLISRNHTDFTTKLFKREGFITLLGEKEIRTYGLYTL
jgi:hypothetical protein